MKKILIVGATYSNNFGDMLFAKMIADTLYMDNEIKFYKLSEFAKNFVGEEKISDFKNAEADALVYMPGGFFGDRHVTSLIVTLYWFVRYFPIGLSFAFKGKPILVLGVGAGPCKYWIMRRIIQYICSRSKRVIVREEDSRDFLKTLGINSEVTSDLAQLISRYDFKDIPLKKNNKKKLLVHVNQNQNVASVIIPAVKKFYSKHKEDYSIVLASDQVCANESIIFEQLLDFARDDVELYRYKDPLELCSVISQCDVVVSYKLHVGIVACSFGKSVIAVPEHYKKVERYYKHIGYPERVLPFYLAESSTVFDLIERYHEEYITVPPHILHAADKNYHYLIKFVGEL